MKRQSSRITVLLLLWLMFWQSVLLLPADAQDESQERDIEAKEVLRCRRQGTNRKLSTSYRYRVRQPANPKGANRIAAQQFPIGSPPKDKTYITIGITLWRVRLATEAESKDPKVSKERMTWDQQEREVVVARISDESPLTNTDLIQLSIEYLPDRQGAGPPTSNRAGYLYVINREQFPDGSLKNARLIFPTRLTYGGDNRVLPGKVVTLPDPSRPFRIRRSDSGQAQAYETYTIILAPVPLDLDLPQELGRRAMELSPDLVAKWERQWSAGEVRADLRGVMGQKREQREVKANGDTSEARGTEDSDEDLTQDDPPPQTVFRRVATPGATMVVTVKVPFTEN